MLTIKGRPVWHYYFVINQFKLLLPLLHAFIHLLDSRIIICNINPLISLSMNFWCCSSCNSCKLSDSFRPLHFLKNNSSKFLPNKCDLHFFWMCFAICLEMREVRFIVHNEIFPRGAWLPHWCSGSYGTTFPINTNRRTCPTSAKPESNKADRPVSWKVARGWRQDKFPTKILCKTISICTQMFVKTTTKKFVFLIVYRNKICKSKRHW